MKLRVAAKVYPEDQDYYNQTIKPLLHEAGTLVEFIGEVGGRDKDAFLGNAHALLFPIDWAEPFGLVMIEAMACGTPVVAFRNGSVPEVMADGITGFVVDTVDEAVEAVRLVPSLSRHACRKVFERRFDAGRMARDYLQVYRRVASCEGRVGSGSGTSMRPSGAGAAARFLGPCRLHGDGTNGRKPSQTAAMPAHSLLGIVPGGRNGSGKPQPARVRPAIKEDDLDE
jgi:hypothetical protein